LDERRDSQRDTVPVEDWERELLKKVASAFRTPNRDELQAVLAVKLLELKRRQPPGIRYWPAYVAKFFYNKAHNFVRDERARARRESTEPEAPHSWLNWTPDEHFLIARVWERLSPGETLLWSMLAECDGNQSRVARKLGLHRNTVRARIKRIRILLSKSGY